MTIVGCKKENTEKSDVKEKKRRKIKKKDVKQSRAMEGFEPWMPGQVGRLRAREGELQQARSHKQAELQRAVDKREVVHLRVGVPSITATLTCASAAPTAVQSYSLRHHADRSTFPKIKGNRYFRDSRAAKPGALPLHLILTCNELQGLACEDKRAAANIEHRQATMLAALERTLAEVSELLFAIQVTANSKSHPAHGTTAQGTTVYQASHWKTEESHHNHRTSNTCTMACNPPNTFAFKKEEGCQNQHLPTPDCQTCMDCTKRC